MHTRWRRVGNKKITVNFNQDWSGMAEILVETQSGVRFGRIDALDLTRGVIPDPPPTFLTHDEIFVVIAIAAREFTIWKIRESLEHV